nr:hypothetical protein C5167_044740 [Ipomoea batatas]
MNKEDIFKVQDKKSLLPLGWIHIIKNEDLEELKEIGLWNIWHCLSWQMERNRCCHQENKEKLLHWPIIRAREAGSGLNTLVKMKELQVIR